MLVATRVPVHDGGLVIDGYNAAAFVIDWADMETSRFACDCDG
jgi:hypothetical protein